MKLKKLTLKNIRSYKEVEINFPEGSLILTGDIGSGKTSILLAIEYSLFGLQPGQRGASLLRNGTNNAYVSLELEVEGKNILIERKLKRNHKTITNEYASITIDNEKVEASLTEIKIKILEWMGYPRELIKKNNLLYRYTVYTPQEQMKQIILEDSETRLNILRHILGIDKYKIIRDNLTIILNQLKEESKILQGEIKNLDDEKSKLEVKKTSINILEKELNERYANFEIKIKETKRVETEGEQLKEKLKEKEYLEKEVEKFKIFIKNKHENKLSLDKEIFEIKKSLEETTEFFNEKEYKDILILLHQKNETLEELNVRYTNLLSEINALDKQKKENIQKKERLFKIEFCPTCLQDIPEAHRHNILNETENSLSKIKQKTSLLEEEIILATKQIDLIKSEKKKLEEEKIFKEVLKTRAEYYDKTKKRFLRFVSESENLERDISLNHKNVDLLKEKILGLTKYDNLLRLKKDEFQKALQEERKVEINVAETKKELELMKKEISEREEEIASKEKSKQTLSKRLELYDWLSFNFLELIEFTERNVLMKLRHEFSKSFSKWFRMLIDQGSLSVRLDESFSPIMLHKDVEMEYSFLSGGERTAVALAYRLALNQTINSILSKIKTKDIVILDEPTDGFSELQLERMREVLKDLKVSQLIIVSHEQRIEGIVDNVLRIKKSGDISQLESNLQENISLLQADSLQNHKDFLNEPIHEGNSILQNRKT